MSEAAAAAAAVSADTLETVHACGPHRCARLARQPVASVPNATAIRLAHRRIADVRIDARERVISNTVRRTVFPTKRTAAAVGAGVKVGQ